jgi:hypothetical protein
MPGMESADAALMLPASAASNAAVLILFLISVILPRGFCYLPASRFPE